MKKSVRRLDFSDDEKVGIPKETVVEREISESEAYRESLIVKEGTALDGSRVAPDFIDHLRNNLFADLCEHILCGDPGNQDFSAEELLSAAEDVTRMLVLTSEITSGPRLDSSLGTCAEVLAGVVSETHEPRQRPGQVL